MRSISFPSALALVAVLVAMPAAAQGRMAMPGGLGSQRLFTFGIGGGAVVPVSDAADALKNGFHGLGYVRVMIPGTGLSAGVNVSFQRLDFKDAKLAAPALPGTTAASTGASDVLVGLGDLKFALIPNGPVRPYLTAGLGAYHLRSDAGGGSSTSDTRFGVNGGAGVDVAIGRVRAFVQGRVDNVYTSEGGAIDAKSIQLVPVTLGLEF